MRIIGVHGVCMGHARSVNWACTERACPMREACTQMQLGLGHFSSYAKVALRLNKDKFQVDIKQMS